jgi:hypothetical protein
LESSQTAEARAWTWVLPSGGVRSIGGAELMVLALVLLYYANAPYRCTSTCLSPAVPLFPSTLTTVLAVAALVPIAAVVLRHPFMRWLGAIASIGIVASCVSILFILPYPAGDANIDISVSVLFVLPILVAGCCLSIWGIVLMGFQDRRLVDPRSRYPGKSDQE